MNCGSPNDMRGPARVVAAGVVIVVTLWVAEGAFAQQGPSWVFPAFPTLPPTEEALTAVNIYNYTESLFDPPLVVEQLPEGVESFETPVKAMITRVSTMMAGDFDAFMETWEPESRVETAERDADLGRTPLNYVQTWASIFDVARTTLIRRIETGRYVILTYKYVSEDGEALSEMEFPAVFAKVDGEWLASQDLARDDLPELSPWVTGAEVVERTIR